MIVRDLQVKIDKIDVLKQIDCNESSCIYEEVADEYDQILNEMYSLCEPLVLIEDGTIGSEIATESAPEGTSVFMILYSIGNGISEYSTKAFAEGDYLKGMLADAMADSALFSLEKAFEPLVRELCAQHHVGISKRLEIPHDIPMESQKYVWEKTEAYQKCGIRISEGYMLDPIKSNTLIYVLTEDEDVFRFQHDCIMCNNYHCKMRNVPTIPVCIKDGEKKLNLMIKEKESILEALMAVDSSYNAVCGGRGICGKCKIRVIEGELPITSSEQECLSSDELKTGMRLACKAYPKEPLIVELKFKGENDFLVVTDCEEKHPSDICVDYKAKYGIAVDIGTTTIAIQLLNLDNKKKVLNYTTINHQRKFGADVINRIKASVEGKSEALQELIQKDLDEGIRHVVKESGVLTERITEVVIAGNTTMIHLLMGYDCKGLGEYPFTPVCIDLIEDSYEKIVGSKTLTANVKILPGISTFVGGDIVSGLYGLDMEERTENILLIDLGTNGEIALGHKGKIITTATAAGPAFEGGNIAWGIGSIGGAIAGVTITGDHVQIRTIEDKSPTGICGTGAIEIVAEMVRNGIIDETGYMDEKYSKKEYSLAQTVKAEQIVFTQQDVREIQLAKAAIRAGIETLLLCYGIEKKAISHVYLSGGFGVELDWQKAIAIGMIPEEFAGKIKAVGNSSLRGAVKYLLSENKENSVSTIVEQAEEINLSAEKSFNDFYMEAMCFEKSI